MGCGASSRPHPPDRADAKTAEALEAVVPGSPTACEHNGADDLQAAPGLVPHDMSSTTPEGNAAACSPRDPGALQLPDGGGMETDPQQPLRQAEMEGGKEEAGSSVNSPPGLLDEGGEPRETLGGGSSSAAEPPDDTLKAVGQPSDDESRAAASPPPAKPPAFQFSVAAVPLVSAYQASEWEETGGEAQMEKELEAVERNCERIEQEMVRRRSSILGNGEQAKKESVSSFSSVEVRDKNYNPDEWPSPGEESSEEEEEEKDAESAAETQDSMKEGGSREKNAVEEGPVPAGQVVGS